MAEVSKIAANGIEYDIKDTAAHSELATVQTDIDSLESNISSIESDISSIQSDVSAAQSDISTLQGNVTTINGNISALQTRVNGLITGARGYCKMDDGTLIQWGVATAQSSGNSLTFPSPTAFVTTLPTVLVTPAYNSGVTIRCIFGVADVTLTGCKVYAYDVTTNAMSTANNLAYRWVALGRWKNG